MENDLLYRILKEHYVQGMTQRNIAKVEGVSTATVSRMIQEGKKRGYVKVTLDLPDNSVPDLEKEIKDRFHLNMVYVTDILVEDPELIMQDVAVAFGEYLYTLLKPGDIVGLSWGRTLSAAARCLKPKKIDHLTFVSMNGGVSGDISDTGVEQVIRTFAKAFDARGLSVQLPSYVSNRRLADELKKDENVERMLEVVQRANIAIFSVGALASSSLLFSTGYFSYEGFQKMKQEGYVGDICARFFKADGSCENDELNRRGLGISLDDLRKKKKKICIVADPIKADALYGALIGGYVDDLFVDKKTALKLLEKTT